MYFVTYNEGPLRARRMSLYHELKQRNVFRLAIAYLAWLVPASLFFCDSTQ